MANPNPSPETRFKPGESGNPGGKTSDQRRMEVENAEKATRIRSHLLDQVATLMEAGVALDLEANLLKLIKDSEDRGLGLPKQTVGGDEDAPIIHEIRMKIIDPTK